MYRSTTVWQWFALVAMVMALCLRAEAAERISGGGDDLGRNAVAVAPRGGPAGSTAAKDTAARPPASTAAAAKLPRVTKPGPPQLGQGMPVFDRIINDALNARHIPGAALAIAHRGKLVVAKGYGLANVKTHEPVSLDTLFCTTSVTKTITATAVLRLVDQGKLSLDDPVYALLGKPRPLDRAALDPQVEKITVRHLLLHAGGWSSKYRSDVLRQTQKISRLAAEKCPLSAETVTRYGLSRPLDFAPGSESHYSNFSYFLAKRVVERTARQPYETYVRQEILRPLGISDMRIEQLAPAYAAGEAHRYRSEGRELPGGREPIAAPAGSWLASVVDLARFLTAISNDRGKPLLSPAARSQMFALPPPPLRARKNGSHIGLGWDEVRGESAAREYHKTGGMAGVCVYVEHATKDIDWVLLLNSDGMPDDESTAASRLEEDIRKAIDATQQWPDRDLFEPR